MLVQKLGGGLGNQMFQYAYAKATALRNKTNFCLNLSNVKIGRGYELGIFNIEAEYTDNIPWYEKYLTFKNIYINFLSSYLIRTFRIFNKNHHIEKDMFLCDNSSVVDKRFLRYKDGYIEGFFQSEKYFKDFEKEIIRDFEIKKELSKKNKDIIKKMESTNSLSIHIRRGDYLSKLIINKFGILPISYYEQGIELIKDKTKKTIHIFFFSDDIQWVKDNFKHENAYFIDWNTGKDSWQDMILMSKCKNNIIANSSFSRWGAYLNKNTEKIVVAPKKRFNKVSPLDIVPDKWIKL